MDISQVVKAIIAANLDKSVKSNIIAALKPFAGQINNLLEQEPNMAPGQDLAGIVADYVMGIIGPVLESGGAPQKTQDGISTGIYSALGGRGYISI